MRNLTTLADAFDHPQLVDTQLEPRRLVRALKSETLPLRRPLAIRPISRYREPWSRGISLVFAHTKAFPPAVVPFMPHADAFSGRHHVVQSSTGSLKAVVCIHAYARDEWLTK